MAFLNWGFKNLQWYSMTRKDSEEIERFSAIFLFWMMQWALIQHDRADGFHQLDHFAAQYIGNAFAIYGGETTGAIIAVQRDYNFGMTLVAQMQRQAGLQLTGGLFGGKLLGGQCLQRLLQIIDFDFSSW